MTSTETSVPTPVSDDSAPGLTSADAAARLSVDGPNRVGRRHHASDLSLLVRQVSNPIVLLLAAASILSLFLGDTIDASIILAIVVLSAGLGFVQERGAVHAVRALLEAVQIHADVIRDGREQAIPLADVVVGDRVLLRAGDVIPADCRLLSADALQVDESALTGESYPVHKRLPATPHHLDDAHLASVFLGTHVVSGSAVAVVTEIGNATRLGTIGSALDETEPPTSFERGLRSFGYLLMRIAVVLVAAVFVVNVVLDRPVLDSLLFSLALAIGITPQMLPAVVTLTLSRGARQMARERVIVKRLSSIEDFGGIDTLCVDKTGTLTLGAVRLDAAIGLDAEPDARIAAFAWLNAHHQNGFVNPLDTAILATVDSPHDPGIKLAELPYDFARKRLTVTVQIGSTAQTITKGAFASVRSVCSTARLADGRTVPITEADDDLDDLLDRLSSQGFRTLGLAVGGDSSTNPVDVEANMTFVGALTFADPPKPGVAATIAALRRDGVTVRMITGDNRRAAAHIATGVGLDSTVILTGADIDHLDDGELAEAATSVSVFAETEPDHKRRIVSALSRGGHSVGFLGDGINDAPAIRAADVGISVDTAVDVAKESAAVVLLDKDLDVLLAGIRRGRQSFANTLKYVFVTTSANFGNMISMAGATLLVPFLPLLPRQLLLLNFLSDIPAMTIANDAVDDEQLATPTRWDIRMVRRFMLVFGLVSSLFDYLTFAVLRIAFPHTPAVFRTGWFIVSVATELLVMLILRTRRPFLHSRPSRALLYTSAAVGAITVAAPFTFLAEPLGFNRPTPWLLLALATVLGGYVTATELAKKVFYRAASNGTNGPGSDSSIRGLIAR